MSRESLVVRWAKHVGVGLREADECNWLVRSVLVHDAEGLTVPILGCVLNIVGEMDRMFCGENYRTRCLNRGLWCVITIDHSGVSEFLCAESNRAARH